MEAFQANDDSKLLDYEVGGKGGNEKGRHVEMAA